MFQEARDLMIDRINTLDWMSDETKQKAVQKVCVLWSIGVCRTFYYNAVPQGQCECTDVYPNVEFHLST